MTVSSGVYVFLEYEMLTSSPSLTVIVRDSGRKAAEGKGKS